MVYKGKGNADMYVYVLVKKNNKTKLANHVRLVCFPREYCHWHWPLPVGIAFVVLKM